MSLIPFIGGGAVGGYTPTGVQLQSNVFRSTGTGTVYSGIKFGSDGGIYERQPAGGWSRKFSWLLSGTNSTFYVVRTVISGSLTTDAGAGPLVLSSDRIYDLQDSVDDECKVSFEIQIADTTVKASRTYDFQVFTLS